jgi:protein-arginine kinase activator protein McsA
MEEVSFDTDILSIESKETKKNTRASQNSITDKIKELSDRLDESIKLEDYEKAALLRDEIQKLKKASL